ncbi:unnamed protein product [Schistosoma spindalis]|nr:unnamed protein product [Schistosoma spindale]
MEICLISILPFRLSLGFSKLPMEELESWKRTHETPTEWRVRRSFLEKNFNKLHPERLECLSHCFTNATLYKVKYPEKVMEEVLENSVFVT